MVVFTDGSSFSHLLAVGVRPTGCGRVALLWGSPSPPHPPRVVFCTVFASHFFSARGEWRRPDEDHRIPTKRRRGRERAVWWRGVFSRDTTSNDRLAHSTSLSRPDGDPTTWRRTANECLFFFFFVFFFFAYHRRTPSRTARSVGGRRGVAGDAFSSTLPARLPTATTSFAVSSFFFIWLVLSHSRYGASVFSVPWPSARGRRGGGGGGMDGVTRPPENTPREE